VQITGSLPAISETCNKKGHDYEQAAWQKRIAGIWDWCYYNSFIGAYLFPWFIKRKEYY
jgi:hypothetical protein